MAFTLKQLCRVGSDLAAGSVKRWDYLSSDTITGAGYFPMDCGIKAGDIVTNIAITLTEGLVTAYTEAKYYMVADAAGVLTATSLTTATSVAAGSVSVDPAAFDTLTGITVQACLAKVDASLVVINSAISELAAADVSFSADSQAALEACSNSQVSIPPWGVYLLPWPGALL